MDRNAVEILRDQFARRNHVCVGLDIDLRKIPMERGCDRDSDNAFFFGRKIADLTAPYAAAFKLNLAFYEAIGDDGNPEGGLVALRRLIDYLLSNHPTKFVILDSKRGDIGNTADKYAMADFDVRQADALTVNPYMGDDSVLPFLVRPSKMAFVLCRTSNPSADGLQKPRSLGSTVYEMVAGSAKRCWSENGNCGLVVGSTSEDAFAEMHTIRRLAGATMPILIPGIGAQGGDLSAAVKGAVGNFLVNSSHGILYAEDPAAEAKKLDKQIRDLLPE